MLTRRLFLGAAMAAGLASQTSAGAAGGRWLSWVQSYVRGGRVIDQHQKGITHSEGQGYGLLLAQAFGDQRIFAELEEWTQRHLAVRQDRLMAWKWVPDTQANVADWHNATDGDLFRAWALLRAERDSGWSGYRETALGIARDIADLCLTADPRVPEEWLLMPGAEARRSAERVLFNPSYILPRALRELGDAAGEPRLIKAAEHGEKVLAELALTGFLPNWVDVTGTGFSVPLEHDFLWGFDALRIPLYLTWSGRADHPAVHLGLELMERSNTADHLVVEATADGRILVESDKPGFLALRALSRCSAFSDWPLSNDYYSDSLLMLAQLAQREGGCRM
ncbi:glycosyl hydrolase family 8 [Paracoccus jeotgali]|uniref:glycosyl hydrolase family 8 n=1 Tax=Paracoccus jeotgali TaxID=2065379 RepID=UPI0028AC348E|nr:glycosyl hydrolase family 8 [Paracoccus jeotgali]